MMTIVTHVHLKEGAEREWDAAMRTRLSAAKQRLGWVGGQLLRQSDKPDWRVIVAWRTRADWEAWHHDRQFAATRGRLDGPRGTTLLPSRSPPGYLPHAAFYSPALGAVFMSLSTVIVAVNAMLLRGRKQ
jgi:heme-degrading monooxygenase HmoA